MTPAELHALAVEKVVERLRSHGGVKALVGDRVAGPGDESPAGDGPRVAVTPGKRHDKPRASAPTLVQVDVRVESSASDEAARDLLLVAVQTALNGQILAPPTVLQCVLHHTGDPDEADGRFSRRDVFGVFVRQPAA